MRMKMMSSEMHPPEPLSASILKSYRRKLVTSRKSKGKP
jgi:hypothetical protein